MGAESYLHRYAIVVMCSWLRKKIRIGPKFKGLNNIPLDLEYPKKSPMYSVYPEYPVCKDKSGCLVGLQCSWDEWLTSKKLKVKSRSGIPSSYELKDQFKDKLKIISIFDVGVVDKGKLKYIVEIEHTHPCTAKKIRFIESNGIIGYEISAQKVMEKCGSPYMIDTLKEWNTQSVQSPQSPKTAVVQTTTDVKITGNI